VYLGATDEVGHRHGWMSEPYLRAVNKADHAIGLVLEALRTSGSLADTVCLVLADHGGHDFDHAAGLVEDLTIPWIISGPGVRRDHRITDPVNIIDTAPTLAYLLGLSAPVQWSGRAVTEVLAS
jgi:arylsulfatase A-like enzyme